MITGGRDLAGLLARLPHAVGAELAEVVGRLSGELDRLGDADRLEVVKATARLEAWTTAVRARAVAALYRSVEAELVADAAELAEAAAQAQAGAQASAQAQAGAQDEAGALAQAGAQDEAGALAQAAGVGLGAADAVRLSWDEERFAHRRVAVELSLVLGVSSWVADREVDLALDLAAHPALGRALAAGRLDRTQAVLICRGLRELTSADPARERVLRGRLVARLLGPDHGPEVGPDVGPEAGPEAGWVDPGEAAFRVDDAGRPVGVVRELNPETRPGATLWMLVPGRLKAILAREVTSADPAAAARAALAAREGRRVTFDPLPSFVAELHLLAATDDAAAAWRNLDATARAAKTALAGSGDTRTLDQLRADIAVGWLTDGAHGLHVTRPRPETAGPETAGRETAGPDGAGPDGAGPDGAGRGVCLPRPAGPLVHLTVADTTMLGLDQEPAVLHGPTGPIPVPDTIARQIAHRDGARWRRLLYHRATGVATDLSPSYRAPAPIADFVRARDGHTTRHPTSCATHLELDHVREFDHAHPERGGPTAAPNLVTTGHRDHQLKTDRQLTVHGDANRVLAITTPSGRSYPSYPHPYADPHPDPPRDADPDPPRDADPDPPPY